MQLLLIESIRFSIPLKDFVVSKSIPPTHICIARQEPRSGLIKCSRGPPQTLNGFILQPLLSLSPSPNLPHEGSRHKLRPQDLDTNSLSLSCTRLDPSRKAAQPGARRPAASLTHLGTRRSERACSSTRGRHGTLGRTIFTVGKWILAQGRPWITSDLHPGRPSRRGAA